MALLPLLIALCSCGEWTKLAETPSPDGSMKAVIEYMDLGACCSAHTRVSLANAEGGTLLEPGVIVEAANAGNRRATWVGNDLLMVEMCSATRIRSRSRSFRERVTRPGGGEDAVRVEVVTLPNSNRNGVVYCAETATR